MNLKMTIIPHRVLSPEIHLRSLISVSGILFQMIVIAPNSEERTGVTIIVEERISTLIENNTASKKCNPNDDCELCALMTLFDAERMSYVYELEKLREKYSPIFEKLLNRIAEIQK